MKQLFAGENKILLYYIIMMVPLVMATTPDASYSMIIRMGYFILLLLPLFNNPQFTPFVFLAFYGFADNACFCFLPDSYLIRYAVVLGLLFLNGSRNSFNVNQVIPYIVLLFYTYLISLFYNDSGEVFLNTSFYALLLAPFIKDEKDVSRLAIGFCLMSGALAVSYYLNFSYFAVDYGLDEDFERGSWQNLNVLAASIGCGLPLTVAFLIDVLKWERSRIFNWLLIGNAVIILLAILSMSSRGAAIAAMGSSLLLFLFSPKYKNKYKVWTVVGLAAAVFLLYELGFFDLLYYRMTSGDTTGTLGSRTEIWATKLQAFSEQGFLSQFFGIGRNNTINLGVYFSTHNDFLTSLIAFGYVGFMLFLVFILFPLFRARKDKKDLFFLLLFVVMECFVVEPFFRGHFHFWMFYLMLNKMAVLKDARRYV